MRRRTKQPKQTTGKNRGKKTSGAISKPSYNQQNQKVKK